MEMPRRIRRPRDQHPRRARGCCRSRRPLIGTVQIGCSGLLLGALVDSLVLAEELARAPSVMDALVGYDKRRRPLARRVQKTAEMLQRLCGIERVTALRVRDALLAGLARFPRFSEEAIRRPLAADVRAIRSASLLGDAR